jgi:type I restriction enzyme M protein
MEESSLTNGNGITREIVAKLWNLCNVLRDDGVTYTDYVAELTFLLFLKMLAETGHEERLPEEYRWQKLADGQGLEQLDYYRRLLLDLGNPQKTKDRLVLAIFTDAQSNLRKPTNLKALTDAIDKLDWFSAREEGLGNLYEGLLEKNANEKKSGAGQYFTPRPLIDCIVRLVKPQPGEVIQDPAAGTGGFLVAADRYIKDHTDDLYKLSETEAFFQRHNAFVGLELVPDTHRLCLMGSGANSNFLLLLWWSRDAKSPSIGPSDKNKAIYFCFDSPICTRARWGAVVFRTLARPTDMGVAARRLRCKRITWRSPPCQHS